VEVARELGLSKDDAERKPRAKPKPKAKAAAGAGGGPGRKRRVSNATTGAENMIRPVPIVESCPPSMSCLTAPMLLRPAVTATKHSRVA